MRYTTRRGIAAVMMNALAKRRCVADGFGFVVSTKHSAGTTITAVPRFQASSSIRPRHRIDASRLLATRAEMPKIHEYVLAAGAEDFAECLARDESCSADARGGIGVFYNRVGAINRDISVLVANVFAEERLKEQRARKSRKRRPPSAGPDPIKAGAETGSYGNDAAGGMGVGATGTKEEGGEEKEEEEEEGLVVLDAFSASGVRALRYLTEVPGVRRVVANDHDTAAIKLIRQAAELCGDGNRLEAHHGDALDTMYAARAGGLGTYDIIDIDPFGCAAEFLDASVQAVKDGGLLCITSTDMPVLSGAQPTVAFARYGSVPTRSGYHHEMSLRILLHSTSAAAGRHRRSIKPVLSVAIDHYVRVFVRVFRSPKAALEVARNSVSYVLQSETCPSFFLQPVLPPQQSGKKRMISPAVSPHPPGTVDLGSMSPRNSTTITRPRKGDLMGDNGGNIAGNDSPPAWSTLPPNPPPLGIGGGECPETGGALNLGGPIWSGPLHDEAWVARAIALTSAAAETTQGASVGEGGVEQCATTRTSDGLQDIHNLNILEQFGSPRPRLATGARVASLLRAVSRELPDVPLFYNLRDMFATLGLRQHPRREQVMGALEAAGYRTSGMHKEPLALKTDAPDAAVWDVLRCWVRDNPQPPPGRAAGVAIVARGPQFIADADFLVGKVGPEDKDGEVARGTGYFLHAHNPEGRWGPRARRSARTSVENAPKPEVLLE